MTHCCHKSSPDNKTQQFKYYLAASIALVTFLVYFSSLQNDFVNYDDNIYVYENPYIRSFDLAMFNESRELPVALGTGMNRSAYFVLRISGAACGIKLAKRPALSAQG